MRTVGAMEFQTGQLYRRPRDASPAWVAESLRAATDGRLAPVQVTLLRYDDRQVTGEFMAVHVSTDREDDYESVYLKPLGDSDEPREFPCREIVGFYLVPEEPIDHSDELRGGV